MNQIIYYNIAGKCVKICNNTNADFKKWLHSFKPFEIEDSKNHLEIHDVIIINLFINKFIDKHTFKKNVTSFEFPEISCSVECEEDKNSFLLKSTSGLEFENNEVVISEQKKGGDQISICFTNEKINHSFLSYSLWMALTINGLYNDILPFHSSVVVYKGEAILFLGESGTGKSTQKDLWLKNFENVFCLNDDSPFLSIKEGIPYVYGSPWSGKGGIYINKFYKIKAFIRVCQDSINKISLLSKIESFGSLYPSVPPFFHHFTKEEDLVCDFISKILGNTSVYKLQCKPENESALITMKALYSEYEK